MPDREVYLGIDVGSVSTKLVAIDACGTILYHSYRRNGGDPVRSVQTALRVYEEECRGFDVSGVGATGSARNLIGSIIGADTVRNEITANAVASLAVCPDVRTIIEIGGQDSKLIVLQDGVVVDFAMNTVCAAGTGSFLDSQANRLNLDIEQFAGLARDADAGVSIAGRCTVFAESDMIFKQQVGHSPASISYGLCESLARNFLSDLAHGKDLAEPIMFQGGVSENGGLVRAFEEMLGCRLLIPAQRRVMGAFGIALMTVAEQNATTVFRGCDVSRKDIIRSEFPCEDCSNACMVVEVHVDGGLTSRWNDRCGKWQVTDKETKLRRGTA